MRNFLGAAGAATVVLLKSADPAALPKKKELQRAFGPGSTKYYKGEGWFRDEIALLERAVQIANGGSATPPWIRLETTDYLHLAPMTKQPLFFIITHAPILISGFDLTDSRMADLRQLLGRHTNIVRWRGHIENFYESLGYHAEQAVKKGITDPSITNPDIASLQQTLAGYGDSALAIATADIQQWYAAYKWKP